MTRRCVAGYMRGSSEWREKRPLVRAGPASACYTVKLRGVPEASHYRSLPKGTARTGVMTLGMVITCKIG